MFDLTIYKPDGSLERKQTRHIAEKDFSDDEKIWVNLNKPTWKELKEIKEAFSLHSLTMEDCFSKRTRIKYEEFRKYTYVVMLGLTNVKERNPHRTNLNYVIGEMISMKTKPGFLWTALSILSGTLVIYFIGVLQLSFVANLSIAKSISLGVLPFLAGDMIKMIVATILFLKLRDKIDLKGIRHDYNGKDPLQV